LVEEDRNNRLEEEEDSKLGWLRWMDRTCLSGVLQNAHFVGDDVVAPSADETEREVDVSAKRTRVCF
jgi:hypothetical protein